jgi:hypothetical protein
MDLLGQTSLQLHDLEGTAVTAHLAAVARLRPFAENITTIEWALRDTNDKLSAENRLDSQVLRVPVP